MTTTADLDALRDCRMVLCLPGCANTVAALRGHGVPTAALAGRAWHRLRHFRHRFDGIVCDLDALHGASTPDLLAALDNALLPGGRLLVHGGTLPRPALAERRFVAGDEHGAQWHKPRPVLAATAQHGLRIGPYADLLVGCRRVLEVGCGNGAFLDALRLRGISCAGIEGNAERAERARRHGHEVHLGGLEQLGAQAVDGLFVGHWLDALDPAARHRALAACRHALAPRGRLVVRCRAHTAAHLREQLEPRHWGPVFGGRVPHDPEDAFLVALATGTPPALPAHAAAVPIDTAALPLQQPPRSPFDLERAERQVTSQGGEDGVLATLFAQFGTTNRHYIEFGCGDGLQCNTTQLRRAGWQGLLMDGNAAPAAPDAVIHAEWITAENINTLFDRHGVPAEPDLLSIDLDGNDYWVWQAITRRPRVVVAEYNANLPADRALVMPYDPAHQWDGSDFYGASLLALAQLGRSKGYSLVYCTQAGVNAFFVRDDLLGGSVVPDPQALYRPPNYWYRGARSRPDLTRAMLSV